MFLIVLVCAVIAVIALKPAIKKAPVAWYIAAVALVALYVAGTQGMLPAVLKSAVFALMQKGMLSVALFVIVMYTGVFPKDSKIRRYLMPIRSELSIIACLLICGHIAAYGMSYLPRMFGTGTASVYVTAGIGVAIVLAVLLVVLGVTSFNFVKSHMSAQSWTKLQRFAYLFYALVYVHILAMLLPSAVRVGASALQSVAVYSIVFGVYAVARVARAAIDRKKSEAGGSALRGDKDAG